MGFPKREAAMRITAVTALVITLAAVAGAVTGFLFTAIGSMVLPGRIIGNPWGVYGVGAGLGAIFGALVGTPIALLMLRNVPLWRATVEVAAAAGVGTVLGRFVPVMSPFPMLAGAILFAVLAAWRLRRMFSPKARATSEPTAR